MSYKVGTICIGQNLKNEPQYNGMQCEIIEPIECRTVFDGGRIVTGDFYLVRWTDGKCSSQRHHQLKRKDRYNEDLRSDIRAGTYTKDREKVSAVISAALKEAKAAMAKREEV